MAKKDKNKVILSFPEPSSWSFPSYVTESGRDVAVEWDAGQTFEAELAFTAMVKDSMKISDHRNWSAWRHPMTGKAGKAGVVELGFKVGKFPYRALCIFNGKKCIVLLCVAYHKGSVWTPADAVETARKRAEEVSAKKAKLNVISIEDSI